MSRPIKMTPDMLDDLTSEINAAALCQKLANGEFIFQKKYVYQEDCKAKIMLSPEAYTKTILLIQNFDSEIAWHGIVHRDEKDDSVFHISNILVYPQTVSGVTVTTDQKAYQTWLYDHDDEVFNHIRMQGHSHVNMSVSPSGTDNDYYKGILNDLTDSDFYIFMIWNKKLDRMSMIYDLKYNCLYENSDIDFFVDGSLLDSDAFIKDAKEKAKPQKYSAKKMPVYSGYRKAEPNTGIGKPWNDYYGDTNLSQYSY